MLWSPFLLPLFNLECRYKTASWHTLGSFWQYVLFNTLCLIRWIHWESWSICNFHKCLEVILNPLINDQGTTNPIHASICFWDKGALCCTFFPAAHVIGDGLSSNNMCGCFLGYSNVIKIGTVCIVSFDESDDSESSWECIWMVGYNKRVIKHWNYWKSL